MNTTQPNQIVAALAATVTMLEAGAWGQCEKEWDDRFGLPDIDDLVECAVWHDDGSGMKLYIAGEFTAVTGTAAVGFARWDGTAWEAMPGGLIDRDWYSRTQLVSGGQGEPLYAIGWAKELHGELYEGVLAWDGTEWSPIGIADPVRVFEPGPADAPERLTLVPWVWNDSVMLQWDGSAWATIASGPGVSSVHEMLWFDDGSGPKLIVLGRELPFAGEGVEYAAAWDGQSWSALGDGTPGWMYRPVVFDDGTGPAVYCLGASRRRSLYRWDGSEWELLHDGQESAGPWDLAVADVGTSPALFATLSTEAQGIAVHQWDGQTFGPALGTPDGAYFLASGAPGSGTGLIVGGDFLRIDEHPFVRMAQWDGSDWSALGSTRLGNGLEDGGQLSVAHGTGNPALDGMVFVSKAPRLGEEGQELIAAWDGTSWHDLGLIANNRYPSPVQSMVITDLGAGPRLVVGGGFSSESAGITSLAQWDGAAWSQVGERAWFADWLSAVVPHQGVDGPGLFVLGGMLSPDTGEYVPLAWMTEESFSAILVPEGPGGVGVGDICGFDDGNGWRLVAGGSFDEIDGVAADMVAAWDGQTWSPLGEGLQGDAWEVSVSRVTPFVSATRRLLFAVGTFDRSGTTPIPSGIAVWDGVAWRDGVSELPFEPFSYSGIRSIDGPDGPLLFIDEMTESGGFRAAIQDGDGWRVLPGEFDSRPMGAGVVLTEQGLSTYLAGFFSHIDDLPSDGFARFGCERCIADFDADGDTDSSDVAAFLNLWLLDDIATDINRDGYVDTRDVVEFLNLWNTGC